MAMFSSKVTTAARAILFVVALASVPWALAAQEKPLSFEVASVKVSKGGDVGFHGGLEPGGRFTVTGMTLRELIGFAYSIGGRPRNGSEISGGPAWIDTEQFDIEARAAGLGAENSNAAAGAASSADLQAVDKVRSMVRTLLADRFHVVVHEETRQLPSYSLTLSKPGTLGPRLHVTDVSCAPLSNDSPPAAPDDGKAGCGGFRMLGPGRLTGHVVSMKMLAGMIGGQLAAESGGDSRPVTDATGIIGHVDVDFNWTPEQAGASIFTAVQEQLGLTLVSSRAPVQVLIIDRADHPTEN
jgi:uncharacterized protein (TIGR03435 family)